MCSELVAAGYEMQRNYEKNTPDYIITMGTAMYFNVQEDSSRIGELRELFWNEQNHKMYCNTVIIKKEINGRSITHISKLMMMQTEGASFHRAIYKYQKRVNPKSNYDMNHIEIVDGERETLLDFVNKIINEPDVYLFYHRDQVKKVKKVKRILTKYGAQMAVELN